MHLIFFDEAKHDPNYSHYHIGAVCIEEAQLGEVEGKIKLLAEEVFGTDKLTASTEFHAAEIYHRKGKRPLPTFLEGRLHLLVYERWLARKAAVHVKRDRKRGCRGVTGVAYRVTMHEAVVRSEGRDVYTGENPAWHLISQYNSDESERGRHQYTADFALLPTVDHID